MTPETLFAQPIYQAIGWALLHSLWQCALVAVLFALASVVLKNSAAGTRYALACIALALALILPIATGCFVFSFSQMPFTGGRELKDGAMTNRVPARSGTKHEQLAPVPDATGETSQAESSASALQDWAGERFTTLLPRLVVVWLCGVALLLLRFAAGCVGVRRLRRSARPLAGQCRETLLRLSGRLRVSRPVRLCESALVEVPTVIGWLRPMLLIPASALTGLSPLQLEALLAHELAHVRRYDYLVNLLQTTVETLLFYHPAVWWLSRRVRAEREHACDDIAVAATGDVLIYARALAALETLRQRRGHTPALALAANGGSLMRRIQRLVKVQTPSNKRSSVLACAALVLMLCGLLAGAGALANAGDAPGNSERDANARRPRREVAVTFVNFPGNNVYDNGRLANKTHKLMRSLASNKIEAVAFVNESRLYREEGGVDDARVGLLREWLDAGHELGNETYRHTSLYHASQGDFQAEVLRGEKIIGDLARERGKRLRYFSYPYLNTGSTLDAKQGTEKFLRERGYQIHPVTIDNMDWLFSRAYLEALRREDTATVERIHAEYIPYMERMFEFYEAYSREVVGREFPQVLMLTAGALNADCFDDLAAMLKRRGYSFVTMEQAMKDEAYSLPDTYTGERGDSWIARWAVTKGMEYRDTEEVYLPVTMQQYFVEFKKTLASKSNPGGKK
ncbi:MAG: polysaccharide deacetylase family protein [Acidobacteria bacterium]|nr:polysaccharide deacetylase family protein [Acidobacteriota bacterium]